MYTTKCGKVWHASQKCSAIGTGFVTHHNPPFDMNIMPCKKCLHTKKCDICLDENSEIPICTLHNACKSCYKDVLHQGLKCPFDEKRLIVSCIPVDILESALTKKPTINVVSPLEYITDQILTLKSPCCGRAFVDFDACLLLLCTCGQAFCGLCFESVIKNEGHSHVRNCKHRPESMNNRYFMSFEDWNAYMIEKKKSKINDVVRKMNSPLLSFYLKLKVCTIFEEYLTEMRHYERYIIYFYIKCSKFMFASNAYVFNFFHNIIK